jgi:hypothetical protein
VSVRLRNTPETTLTHVQRWAISDGTSTMAGSPSYNGGELADHAAEAVNRLRLSEDHSNDQRAQVPKLWLGPRIRDDVELRERSPALRTLIGSCYWPVPPVFPH